MNRIIVKTTVMLMFLLALTAGSNTAQSQTPSYSCDIRNESFISSKIFEFDVYLTRTGSTPLELACFNTGIKVNTGFVNGGTITPSLVAGSDLLPAQAPVTVGYDAATNCVMIAPQVPPRNYTNGVTSGTVISTSGSKVCRVRLTNTADYGNDPVNYTWSMNVMPYHTVVSAFLTGTTPKTNADVTSALSHSESNNLVVYLQGLYEPGTGNRKTQDDNGDHFAGPVADQVTIQLAQAASPFAVEHSFNGNLYSNGKCSFSVPGTITGMHYVVIKHRNSIETWSSAPVDFSGSAITYNFTDSDTRAYGNNLKQIGSIFAVYAGDVDQDGGVGTADMGLVDNQSSTFGTGYMPEDVDGDGSVGTIDMGIVDNNSANFVSVITPAGKAPIQGK